MSSFSVSMTKLRPKPARRGRVHFYVSVTVHPQEKPGRSQAEAQSRILESETEAETIEKCIFLACSTCSLKLLRPTCPSSTVGWTSVAHSQKLGRARGTPKKRREDYRSQRDGEHQENTATASTKRGS